MENIRIITRSWTEKFEEPCAENMEAIQYQGGRLESTGKSDSRPVRRDKHGTIDYSYYMAKANTIRNESIVDFIRIIKSTLTRQT
ncbi:MULTISPECIES: hypothetical protein [Desulfosediminicola]|uniref:hypothetical protein n=1 Tax=Desulfosediminicola TaxID=2886823 RepID=UPI0010AD4196|nr:hypothetical protein [Desulfosediminicola ganghwensis]